MWSNENSPLEKVGKVHFFFLRVYLDEAGVIHHLANVPGDNMQKTQLQNSSPFSHSFKMFECMSTQENCKIRCIGQFSPDMVSEVWLAFPGHSIFSYEIFLKHYLEHRWIDKIPKYPITYTLDQKNASFGKNTKLALIAMGFEQFYEFQKMTYPWIFQDIERTIRYFWTGFLATCVKFQWSNMTLPGSLELDPGSHGKPIISWCVSFETECIPSKTCLSGDFSSISCLTVHLEFP